MSIVDGTLGCRGTPVRNHCTTRSKSQQQLLRHSNQLWWRSWRALRAAPPGADADFGLLLLSELLKPLLGRTRSRAMVFGSHSIVSSSRTARPCSPWGGRWIGHWRTTWLTVCFSAPHSQAAEEAIPHFYRQERKRPTPVWRRLSRTQALLGRSIPWEWVPVSVMKMRSLVGLSVHSALHW